MAENEAPTMTGPMSARTAGPPQTAPATYPEAAPTVASQVFRASLLTSGNPIVGSPTADAPAASAPDPQSAVSTSAPGIPVPSIWARNASAPIARTIDNSASNAWARDSSTPSARDGSRPVPALDPSAALAAGPSAMPWAVPPANAPTDALPRTGVPANAVLPVSPVREELLGFSQRQPQMQSTGSNFMTWLRTPLVTLVACGVTMFGVGFGAGFVIGRDNAGAAVVNGAITGTQAGPGQIPGSETGAGSGPGQGQRGQGPQGLGGPMGQQDADGTTDTTGLSESQ
jgi:hypothetical protein